MNDVDTFIQECQPSVRERLQQIRQAIKAAVPEATEVINYGIPTFQISGKNMVHYGPGKTHIGFYATPDGNAEFEDDLNKYKRGKGSVQFPLDQPLPLDLITRIAVFRSEQLKKGER
jgi:uncharacterized protein YdhG (YjbR/CyaY superfamily)